jgi:hypothetical protein
MAPSKRLAIGNPTNQSDSLVFEHQAKQNTMQSLSTLFVRVARTNGVACKSRHTATCAPCPNTTTMIFPGFEFQSRWAPLHQQHTHPKTECETWFCFDGTC